VSPYLTVVSLIIGSSNWGDMYRRKILLTSGVALSTVLAGCSSDEGSGDDSESANGDVSNGDSDESADDGDGETSSDDDSSDEASNDNDDDGGDEVESVDQPDTQSFSGSGAAVESGVSIEGGLTVVDTTHTGGSSNFQVSLVDDSEFDDNFVNEIGEYEGETADLIDGGEYMLDVEADGDWEIEIRQPRAASGDGLPQSLDSNQPTVSGPFDFTGSHVATGSHSGESNFAVHVYPDEGNFGELLFNEIGEYEGETTFNFDGVGWVAVQADGDWSIEIE